jgi:integrase
VRVRRAKRRKNVSNHRLPGDRYTSNAIGRALRRIREKHGIPHWTVYQLRHAKCTEVATQFGFDAARKVLGKKSVADTVRYDHSDATVAAEVMRVIG